MQFSSPIPNFYNKKADCNISLRHFDFFDRVPFHVVNNTEEKLLLSEQMRHFIQPLATIQDKMADIPHYSGFLGPLKMAAAYLGLCEIINFKLGSSVHDTFMKKVVFKQ